MTVRYDVYGHEQMDRYETLRLKKTTFINMNVNCAFSVHLVFILNCQLNVLENNNKCVHLVWFRSDVAEVGQMSEVQFQHCFQGWNGGVSI